MKCQCGHDDEDHGGFDGSGGCIAMVNVTDDKRPEPICSCAKFEPVFMPNHPRPWTTDYVAEYQVIRDANGDMLDFEDIVRAINERG